MADLRVIAVIQSAPGFEERIKTELEKLIEPTRKEPGCVAYDLYQDGTDASTFIFLEQWQGSQFLESHLQSEHLQACMKALEGMIQELKVYRLCGLSR